MSNLFKTVEAEAFRAGITPRTRQSREWFRKKVQNMRSINRRDLMKEEEIIMKNRGGVGGMYMFFYDPKTKDTLPYWDNFPLIVMVQPIKGGFQGLNLHYLPMTLRAKFLDGLMDQTNNNKFDETTRFELSYNYLKRASKLKYFKPCFKQYLNNHVEGRLAMVPAPEWEIATFLPTAQWSRASQSQVWKDSRSMI
jgi:hypothetical protein